MKPVKGDDLKFLHHAQCVINTQFHAMNTDLHWLALFLHPLCRKLVISIAVHSRKVEDAYQIAAHIAKSWGWTKEMAIALITDIKAYSTGMAPFQGRIADVKDWWKSLLVMASGHPLKALAIKIFSIVPHAAEVEQFFSNLGGVQSVKCSRLTVPHLETLGTLRSHYGQQLNEATLSMGKSTQCKHAHMHTQPELGINTGRAEVLLKSFTLTEPTVIPQANDEFYDPENITMEDIDAEFDKLDDQVFALADGDGLGSEVPLNEVYDLSELESI